MVQKVASSPGASFQSIDDYWSALTDDELREVKWTTAEPLKLDNIQPNIPDDLPDFTIELEYQLDRATDQPVPCAHCPHHQPRVMRGTAWLFVAENPFKALEEVGRRLHGYYLVGSQNSGTFTTARLEQFVRETAKDLEAAAGLLKTIGTAGAFFARDHLVRLSKWSRAAMPERTGQLALGMEGELHVADYGRAGVTLALADDWAPPGDLFLSLRGR